MTEPRWQRLQELFHEAMAQPQDQRDDFVRQACGADNLLHQELLSLLRQGSVSDEALDDPGRLALRLRRFLAAGGMGAAYEADQERPRRSVALRILLEAMSKVPSEEPGGSPAVSE